MSSRLRFVTLKGSPYRTHLLPEGKSTALCGKAPGVSKASLTKARSGWLVYKNRCAIHRPVCEACAAIAKAEGR